MPDIHYNLVSLIDFLGLVQAMLLGGLLLFGSKEKKPLFLLAIVVLTYGLELVEAMLEDMGIVAQVPQLMFLPFNFHYLTFPVFYLYAKSLVQPVSIKKHWKILLPGMVEFVLMAVLFLLPVAKKQALVGNEVFRSTYQFVETASLFYNILFAYLTIRLVDRHQKNVLNFFSATTDRLLKWVKLVAILLIVFMLMWIPFFFFSEVLNEKYGYPIMSAINVVFIFWLALSGFKQSLVYVPLQVSPSANDKAAATPQPVDVDARTFEKIKLFLQTEKPFTNPQLLLSDLARQLNMPQRTLSNLINEHAGTNFNQFINQYRVEEAKQMMADPAYGHLNLLGIGREAGFNSKTGFYTTFKQLAGMTPAKFQRSL